MSYDKKTIQTAFNRDLISPSSFSAAPSFVCMSYADFGLGAKGSNEPAHTRLAAEFEALEVDRYMKNRETYRLRRLTKYLADTTDGSFAEYSNQIFFQEVGLNSYAAGVKREYPKLSMDIASNEVLKKMAFSCLSLIQPLHAETKWIVGTHFIRTVCLTEEIAKPSPDGVHQDGHDYLSISIMRRDNVGGGSTNLYDIDKNMVADFELTSYLDTVLVNDRTMYHDATPIHRLEATRPGLRDVIILDFDIAPQQVTKELDSPRP